MRGKIPDATPYVTMDVSGGEPWLYRPRKPRERSCVRARSPVTALGVVAFGFALGGAGCKRGALSDWLKDRGAVPSMTATPAQLLSGVDCPAGLARCVGGEVEVSVARRVPRPCPQNVSQDACVCPWIGAFACPAGCASEGLELVVEPEHAPGRLCAPDSTHPVSRPAPDSAVPAGACVVSGQQGVEASAPLSSAPPPAGATLVGYRCLGSVVVSCGLSAAPGSPAVVVAACLHGCARDGELLMEEGLDPEAAPRILCAR